MTKSGDAPNWESMWANNQTGWDLDAPHPALVQVFSSTVFFPEFSDYWGTRPKSNPTAKALVPGCGYGHEVDYFQRLGFDALGVDISDTAVQKAQKKYGSASFICADILDADALQSMIVKNENQGNVFFDLIYDRAVLCALPVSDRQAYLKNMDSILAPGGVFLSIPFLKVDAMKDPPPYSINEVELNKLFQSNCPHWEVLGRQEYLPVMPGIILREAIVALKKTA